ncbi:ABC transporter permease [Anaerobranca gottschalkii]|uniref:Nucleoside ABC transporter membrane protein n=1 Tax=Anaerobranca gottschalkii DSM 13577 TaxID=1120990 RepID=A0A1H9Z873_9FIRM|nr:ABC transporter permease [Anaerobranca gottschalkii]SES77709.1 nucleoside ABC transporter membrane protein [Anaerobranca gottschalkii DSM 13577]
MKNNIYIKYFKTIGQELFYGAVAVIAALLVGSLFILFTNVSPIEAYIRMFNGAFGSIDNIYATLFRSTPIILTGLSVAFAFRCGLFNIGAEGQYLIGAFAAGWAGFYFTGLPKLIHLPLTLIIAVIAGGLWASIAGVLKAKLGANEVINTIMLNHIAFSLTIVYGIRRLATVPGEPGTPHILDSARITSLGALIGRPAVRVHGGFILAILAAFFVWYFLFKTKSGYEIRAVGFNPHGAEYGGINVAKNVILAMFISGALAGLAGAGEVLGTHGRFIQGMNANHGFTGIAVALVGKNNPFTVVISGILFGALAQGGFTIGRILPRDIVVIIQALVIFAIALSQVLREHLAKKRAKEAIK